MLKEWLEQHNLRLREVFRFKEIEGDYRIDIHNGTYVLQQRVISPLGEEFISTATVSANMLETSTVINEASKLEDWMVANGIKFNEVFSFEGLEGEYTIEKHKVDNRTILVKLGDFFPSNLSVNEIKHLVIKRFPNRPKKGESYYIPGLSVYEEKCKPIYCVWTESDYDISAYKAGLVCKTEYEAQKRIYEINNMIREAYFKC